MLPLGLESLLQLILLKSGWNVAATMRTTAKGADLSKFPNVRVIRLDVMDQKSIQEAIEATKSAFGAIDVVFNNAGYALVGAFEAMSEARDQAAIRHQCIWGDECDSRYFALF